MSLIELEMLIPALSLPEAPLVVSVISIAADIDSIDKFLDMQVMFCSIPAELQNNR